MDLPWKGQSPRDLYFTEHPRDPYFILTNVYELSKPMVVKGNSYASVEHLYQTFRFLSDVPTWEQQEFITTFQQVDPWECRELSHNIPEKFQLKHVMERRDWKTVKNIRIGSQFREDVMYECLRAKFNQCKKCKDVLLSTGNARLHLKTFKDEDEAYFWGTGEQSLGRDRLGALLEQLRDELRLNMF